jgi:hypothetical protein
VSILVGFIAYRAYLGSFDPPESYVLFLAASALAIMTLFRCSRLYQPQRGVNLAEEVRQLLFAWVLVGRSGGRDDLPDEVGRRFLAGLGHVLAGRRDSPQRPRCASASA